MPACHTAHEPHTTMPRCLAPPSLAPTHSTLLPPCAAADSRSAHTTASSTACCITAAVAAPSCSCRQCPPRGGARNAGAGVGWPVGGGQACTTLLCQTCWGGQEGQTGRHVAPQHGTGTNAHRNYLWHACVLIGLVQQQQQKQQHESWPRQHSGQSVMGGCSLQQHRVGSPTHPGPTPPHLLLRPKGREIAAAEGLVLQAAAGTRPQSVMQASLGKAGPPPLLRAWPPARPPTGHHPGCAAVPLPAAAAHCPPRAHPPAQTVALPRA